MYDVILFEHAYKEKLLVILTLCFQFSFNNQLPLFFPGQLTVISTYSSQAHQCYGCLSFHIINTSNHKIACSCGGFCLDPAYHIIFLLIHFSQFTLLTFFYLDIKKYLSLLLFVKKKSIYIQTKKQVDFLRKTKSSDIQYVE